MSCDGGVGLEWSGVGNLEMVEYNGVGGVKLMVESSQVLMVEYSCVAGVESEELCDGRAGAEIVLSWSPMRLKILH